TLTPASSATYTATFSPTSAGSASGQISFVSDASNSPTVVSLSGAGVAQPTTLSVSPTSIPFGNVVVGNSSTKPGTLSASGGTVTVSSVARSEEHTSELQSHLNLVCRLLLEKKKTTLQTDIAATTN